MSSKFAAFATIALGLAAAVPAAAYDPQNERPDTHETVMGHFETVQREAGSLYRSADLSRLGLQKDDIVSVTVFPSSDKVEQPGRDDG